MCDDTKLTDQHILVIDTSYGSTVGIVGYEPLVSSDSRGHVETLAVHIQQALNAAGLEPHDITHVIAGVGPAPYTGLRAGIVSAQQFAFASGAQLIGQDILSVQRLVLDLPDDTLSSALSHSSMQSSPDRLHDPLLFNPNAGASAGADATVDFSHDMSPATSPRPFPAFDHQYVLAVNDARRHQLYCALYHKDRVVCDMTIDTPDNIVHMVHDVIEQDVASLQDAREPSVVIVGHGAVRYEQAWHNLRCAYTIRAQSLLDMGAQGLRHFACYALSKQVEKNQSKPEKNTSLLIEPLYLRRPDVSVPNPHKHVLAQSRR